VSQGRCLEAILADRLELLYVRTCANWSGHAFVRELRDRVSGAVWLRLGRAITACVGPLKLARTAEGMSA
jgi:hypothetical protein